MTFAVEKFLQSSNGTGRKEKGLHAILYTLKKQHSLFADILDIPIIDSLRIDWSEIHLRLFAANEVVELSNTARSLFLRMKVEVDENNTPGIPNMEPLSSFMSPNKAYRYSSEGLQSLLKREMRSTNRQLLVRWFWTEANIIDDPESPSNKACEVIIQLALANNELKKRKRMEYEVQSSPEIEDPNMLRNMNAMLEKIYHAQISHYTRVEALLTSLVSRQDLPTSTITYQLQQTLANEQRAPPMPARILSTLSSFKNTNFSQSNHISQYTEPMPGWEHLFATLTK